MSALPPIADMAEQTVRKIFGTKKRVLAFLWRLGADGEMNMKKLLISTVAAALVATFAVSAEAAGNKQKVSADVQASCKAQAAKKFSAIHFLKRRNFVNNCVAQHANTKAKPAVKPTTTGQAPKQAQ
jgi:BMFP domain-containing protein YqiC